MALIFFAKDMNSNATGIYNVAIGVRKIAKEINPFANTLDRMTTEVRYLLSSPRIIPRLTPTPATPRKPQALGRDRPHSHITGQCSQGARPSQTRLNHIREPSFVQLSSLGGPDTQSDDREYEAE